MCYIGLGIVWILSITIAFSILLIDYDSFRFPVSIPMWLNNDIKHLSSLFLENHLLELNTMKKIN